MDRMSPPKSIKILPETSDYDETPIKRFLWVSHGHLQGHFWTSLSEPAEANVSN